MINSVRRPRVLAIVQAGGRGSRMDVLTRETPKPALPFGGSYRLIDFPLSNLRNSDVDDVWLSVQYLGRDLADAVANGRPWDLDRARGGFRLNMPEQGSGSLADEGFVSGNAEGLLADRDAIRRHAPDVVIVLSADHAYRLDYREVIEQHLATGAECTVVTTEIPIGDAEHHAVVTADRRRRVTRVDYKPERPASGTVATEVFVYSPGPLIEVLETEHRRLANDPATTAAPDGSALGDFGEHLLPALIDRGRTFAYALDGYWRDLGRPDAYFAAHQELLHDDIDLFDPSWPVVTNSDRHLPARVLDGARVSSSLLGAGCTVAGTVVDSVLGPGVVVEAGARVVRSVIFADVTVQADARVAASIVADGTVIGAGAKVGVDRRRTPVEATDLVLIGRECVVPAGATVARGARLEPGTTAA